MMLPVMSVSFECHFLSTHNLLVNSLTDFKLWLQWWLECDGRSALEPWNLESVVWVRMSQIFESNRRVEI